MPHKGIRNMQQYLKETKLIDYTDIHIQEEIKKLSLPKTNTTESAKIIYNYIRDSIQFDIPIFICKASETLAKKRGQVITKNILLMAFCRACGIPTRTRIINQNMEISRYLIGNINYFGMKILAPEGIVPHIIPQIYIYG